MTRLMEHARQIFYLCLGLFFLTLSGLVVQSYFAKGPLERLSSRLLEKDGRLLIKIVSHPGMRGTLKTILASEPLPPEQQPLNRAVKALLKDQGKLLLSLTGSLLQAKSVRGLLTELAGNSSPTGSNQKSAAPFLEKAISRAMQELFANDGKLALSLTSVVLKQWSTLPSSNSPPLLTGRQLNGLLEKLGQRLLTSLTDKEGKLARLLLREAVSIPSGPGTQKSNAAASKAMAQTLEKVASIALEKLLAKDAKLARLLLRSLREETRSQDKGTQGSADAKLTAKTLENLGRYVTDKLLASRAKPLRAILEALLGPELMRLTRELRRTVKEIRKQTEAVKLKGLVQAAAYSTSKGALETYLKSQAKAARSAQLQRETMADLQTTLWSKVEKKEAAQCFAPGKKPWLTLRKGTLQLGVAFERGRVLQCPPLKCKLMLPLLGRVLTRTLKKTPLSYNRLQLRVSPPCP